MFYSFDRIEEGLCVFISDEEHELIVNPELVSPSLTPGDIAVVVEQVFYLHTDETARRKKQNSDRADSLFK